MYIADGDNAKKRIIELYPEFKNSNFKSDSTGWGNFVVKVDDTYIFRFPRTKESLKAIKKEENVLGGLSKILPSNIEIPNYLYKALDKEGPFVGYKMIMGEFLTPKIYNNMSDKEKDSFAKNIADILTIIHNLDINKYIIEEINPIILYKDLLDQIKNICFQYFNVKEQEWALGLFSNYFNDKNMTNYKPCIIHGDLSDDHILINKEKIGIIDFGDVRVFDPAYDFIWTFDYGESFFDNVYKYYNGPKDLYFKARIKDFYVKRTAFYGIIYGTETNNKTVLLESLTKLRKHINK